METSPFEFKSDDSGSMSSRDAPWASDAAKFPLVETGADSATPVNPESSLAMQEDDEEGEQPPHSDGDDDETKSCSDQGGSDDAVADCAERSEEEDEEASDQNSDDDDDTDHSLMRSLRMHAEIILRHRREIPASVLTMLRDSLKVVLDRVAEMPSCPACGTSVSNMNHTTEHAAVMHSQCTPTEH